ncbi:metal ABC transporter solute-binding protein, Zn/Mn family [Salinisphaera hydrothermalis]|uniref:Putative ABC-type metal ion transport system, periplasmic component n=2 Tax=Salinisphaera TaxID=180541 RepID=A0A084IHU3_SALHC|nr:zinc ABC transporter substrate-binding protein [Salinisphaera hydrothermalis]KEZ76277.1 putative ABC-type metal ion transport system, periplasmic component [Salinisphaera hydrothermalis C41B8]
MAASAASPVRVVAAESSYGSVVETIGGSHVKVVSLLDSPSVNPHQFEASPRIGRQLANANLVVMNGLGFDGWMEPLLSGTSNPKRVVIRAADAASGIVSSDKNEHLFYSPQAMLATASQVAGALARIDPAHTAAYRQGLVRFQAQMLGVYGALQKLIAAHPNLTVTATVPVYNYMLALLGYHELYRDIQYASEENSQPSAQQVKTFIQALQQHKVDLLIYNVQVHNRLTDQEVQTARDSGVPTVGVSAIPLHGENYAQWQIKQLKAIKQALDKGSAKSS